jgi:hypothetical protein
VSYSETLTLTVLRLRIDEELDLEKEVLDKQADALGSIKVSVVRATVTKRSEPLLVSSQYQPSITADVAKEIVKDQHVSHSME